MSEEKKQNNSTEQENPQTDSLVSETEQETQTAKNETTETEKSETDILKDKNAELSDKLLRTMAEYDNFRKRSAREKEAIYPQATAAAVTQFAPILDTFDRALSAPCEDIEFKKGVEMIFQHFQEALKKLGVEEFGASGDLFNPDMHNAVMHIEDPEAGTNIVVEVFQKGYKLGERTIRHAMVKVAN